MLGNNNSLHQGFFEAPYFMAKLEADVVRPFNPPFYDQYIDVCFSKKKKGEPDALLERLNRYHPNIGFTQCRGN